MNEIEAVKKEKLLECINYIRNFIEELPSKRNCATCISWDYKSGVCEAADNKAPPHHIQRDGCPHWTAWDEIPFL